MDSRLIVVRQDETYTSGWHDLPMSLKRGDTFAIAGRYRRRTVWEWLTRQPRQLVQYTVISGEPNAAT